MSKKPWDRFKTGQAMQGRLMQQLVEQAGAGAILPAGAQIGDWRIVELLGSGGMSHVYLAERADGQFAQQVALKLVRKNVNLMDRLRHERQIVATLRHPHIVSLVDGGETAEGDLWFAMALVEGVEIDQYARTQQLDWRARLKLFDAVCAALEYAHGRGLIHRDIKPANILVDAQGHPRLLDFGIALEDDGGDGSDDRVLTLGFASPEQLAGQALTTTSDIYQLGLVLKTLFGGRAQQLDGNTQVIDYATVKMEATTADKPARKVTVAQAHARLDLLDLKNNATGKVPDTVRADLGKLIARATAIDPQARYATAAALREDIDNVLTRRPLLAERDATSIRLARLIERNRVAVVVGMIAVVTLFSLLSYSALRLRDERNQAIANEQRANAVSEFLVNTLSQANPYAQQKGSVSVLEAMDHAADSVNESLTITPELRRQLRATIGNVYLNIDEAKRCLNLLGADQAERDLKLAPRDEQARAMILRSECHLALDERDASWRWLESAQAALGDQHDLTALPLRAFILVDQGQLLSLNGKLAEANAKLESGLVLALQSNSLEQQYRANRMLGSNLQVANDDLRAIALLERAHALASQTRGPSHRSTLTTAGMLALSQAKLERWQDAEASIQGALAAAELVRQRGATPDIVIAQLRDNFADILWRQRRFADCIVQSKLSLAIYQRMASASSSQGFNPSWRTSTCAYQDGQLDVAFDYARQALRYAENGVSVGVINALRMLAAISARRDQLDLAKDFLARAELALTKTEVATKTVFSALHLTRALLAIRAKDATGARTYLAQADASIRESGTNPDWLKQERAEIMALIQAQSEQR
jgi:eukaryotic-like serine/threonine-protein kinase